MSMVIEISKDEVLNEVEKRSSLEGYAMPDRYDMVWASESKAELLESSWIEGCGAILQLVKDFVACNESGDRFRATLIMPTRFNRCLEGSIVTSLKMAIVCNMLSRWLSVTAPELAPKYDEEAKSYLEDARIKLYTRVAPTRALS